MIDHPAGKVTASVFAEVILRQLGRADGAVQVGPRHGVDVGVVAVAPGTVMALSSDPVFIVPAFGWERAAWFAVHILASDTATSGLPLRWMAVDLNLPVDLTDRDLAQLWGAFHRACAALGLAVVTGHTGRYQGCQWPMVGGAVCMALGDEAAYVTPAMARAGDRVVITKGAAIEATALFAATFPARLSAQVGPATTAAADALFASMTVVPEARLAAAFGLRELGVTAMHDATEGGVLGGLVELATASGTGLVVHRERIPVRDEVRQVCAAVGIDPYASISEGTLVAAVRPDRADAFVARLERSGIPAAVVGELTAPEAGLVMEIGGREQALEPPAVDPFWAAFDRWSREAS